MGKIKEMIEKIKEECTALYEHGGTYAVTNHVIQQQELNNPMYDDVKYQYCTGCEAGMPNIDNTCLVCGSSTKSLGLGDTLQTIGDVRELMKDLSDDDLVVVEACDEYGDVEDLYPMSLDVIEGIELLDGTTVSEVRFCQRPNAKPDDRDKQPLVNKVIEQIKDDIFNGDVTVLDELLKFIPWELLKHSLPEEQWKNFK